MSRHLQNAVEIYTLSVLGTIPQTLPGLLSSGTAALLLAPPFFRKQVPPSSRVQTKLVQSLVAAHFPPQTSPCSNKKALR